MTLYWGHSVDDDGTRYSHMEVDPKTKRALCGAEVEFVYVDGFGGSRLLATCPKCRDKYHAERIYAYYASRRGQYTGD